MIRLAVIALGIIMVFDFTAISSLAHYRDYLLAGLAALLIQPWCPDSWIDGVATPQFDD